MEFTVTTRNGKVHTVDSKLTDEQARDVLRAKPDASAFERDLSGRQRLSPKQVAWLHVLAFWTQHPREDKAADNFPTILAMLAHAREAGKKFPKIKLRVDGQPIVLALNRAGKVNVTDGGGYGVGAWFGAIQPSGAFREGRGADAVLPVLRELESDPVAVATQHGVATGECCFCARELTTKESRTVGYGPICAGKFGLPWGHVDPELERLGSIIPDFES